LRPSACQKRARKKKKKKHLGINPGQPAGKGRGKKPWAARWKRPKKKEDVLTLGNPPEKGEKKKEKKRMY
jgi:hypothetical protein